MDIARQKERTLRAACFSSLWAPLAGAVAVVLGRSVTLAADFMRRTAELAVLFATWLIARRIAQGQLAPNSVKRFHLEQRSGQAMAAVMILAFAAVFWTGISRLLHPVQVGNVLAGILVASGGGMVNGWFWYRSRRLAWQESTPLIESQWRLYRAKTAADLTVVTVMTASVLLRRLEWSVYIDPAGSLFIGLFLLFSAWRTIQALYPERWAAREG